MLTYINWVPTCQAETKDGEENQDVEGNNGVLDGGEGVQVTTAVVLLPATLSRTWQKQKREMISSKKKKNEGISKST